MITKAELLWTRVCPLSCSYCNMATGEENSRSLKDWKKGIDQLKQLDCKFLAVYGAEPLKDFTNFPQVVGYAEEIGIDTTVITSGVVSHFKEKLKALHYQGAKSLSMSYDINPLETSTSVKTKRCIDGLEYFKSLGNIRDVAAITTVTKDNYQGLLWMIEEMSKKGIWTFFDLIHPNLRHPGSKCKGENTSLLFISDQEKEDLVSVLERVLVMKKEGFLCHTTSNFVNTLKTLLNTPEKDLYSWNCYRCKEFPSWVTINPDGKVHPCDDFQTDITGREMTSLVEYWDTTVASWRNILNTHKCTCCWNTHIDSHAVKTGLVPITDYIHGRK